MDVINYLIREMPILLILFCMVSCSKIQNFTDVDGPVYSGNFAPVAPSEIPDQVHIVTYNIEFAIKIKEAIKELGETEDLMNADIIFLQEMDEIGSEAIASALQYNYIYYPSSRNLDGTLYGLTLLSKWPIIDEEKIILPYGTPGNDRKRIAMTANVVVGDAIVRVYNVHFSTFIVPKTKRREQFRVVRDHVSALIADQKIDRAIISGDFNTDKSNDINYLIDIYSPHGFILASNDVGPTWQTLGGVKKYRLDHIFTWQMELIEAGKPAKSDASDHLPIWMRLKL